jgi:hypothetical protein
MRREIHGHRGCVDVHGADVDQTTVLWPCEEWDDRKDWSENCARIALRSCSRS